MNVHPLMPHARRAPATTRAVFVLLALCALLHSELSAAALPSGASVPQGLTVAPSATPLFASEDVLHIRLRAPFAELLRLRDTEQEYPATLALTEPTNTDNSGPMAGQKFEAQKFDAKISARGNFRLQHKNCQLAQLWVDLKKSQLADTVFEGQNRLKLTLQCRPLARYEAYLMREEQAYRMLRTVSPLSLGTRRVRLTLEFTDADREQTVWAFFSQHHSRLAEQQHLKRLHTAQQLSISALDPSYSNLVDLFQYMIGNTDYSQLGSLAGDSCCHNSKPLQAEDGAVYSVPYDFDSSGYVDASYAQPTQALQQRSVRQRIYRGFCVPPEIVRRNLAQLGAQRAAILTISDDYGDASTHGAARSRRYLEDFFSLIEDPRAVQRLFIDGCRRTGNE